MEFQQTYSQIEIRDFKSMYFFPAVQEAFRTKLNFSSSYHLKTDGQTKRVN